MGITQWNIVAVIVALIIGLSAPILLKKNDSLPEELAEAFLHMEGIDIEFSPDEDEDDDDDPSKRHV